MENNQSGLVERILQTPKPLSEEQRRAVLSKAKYLRIVAGAGTGKTETLTRRIVYLIMHEKVEPKSIVAFTFTEKAAQGMKSRIYDRVKELGGDEACAKLGDMYVGTIHGFCLRVLEDVFHYGDHETLDENKEMAFLLRFGWALGLGKSGRYSDNCELFLKSVNVVYDELLPRGKLKEANPVFFKQLEKYEEFLRQYRLLNFGQQVAYTVHHLEAKPEALDYIKHLIVDEYQDINRAQEKLIRLIGDKSTVFIVGDPRQSIYQWRGSDEKCFEDFLKVFPEAAQVTLRENRRSVNEIVNIANNVASHFGHSYDPLQHKRPESGLACIIVHDTPESEADWMAKSIQELVLERKACSYSDIGILVRSVATSSGPFLEAFRRMDIPFVVGGKVGLFKRDEIQAVAMLFTWLYEDGFWLPNPSSWHDRIQGDDLLDGALDKWNACMGKSFSIPSDTAERLTEWKSSAEAGKFRSFIDVFEKLLAIIGYLNLNSSNKIHATIMANLGRFSSLLDDYEASVSYGGRKKDIKDFFKGLFWFINSYAATAYEEQQSDDLRGIDAVQIMTIHQAKGLEWPVVFMPSLDSDRFPPKRAGKPQEWLVPRELFNAVRYEGSQEDERRLFYVGVTRARDLLCLGYFSRSSRQRHPSIFVSEIGDKLISLHGKGKLPDLAIHRMRDEEELDTFSAGEVISYLRCPCFYRFREIWGYKPEIVRELGYGKSLHFCLRTATEPIKHGKDPVLVMQSVVRKNFHLPYAPDNVQKIMMNNAERVLTNFVIKNLEDIRNIEAVEVRLEFPMERSTVAGKADVIMKTGEKDMQVRDYKTSDEVTTPAESALQVRMYTMGLRMLDKPIGSASVANLRDARIEPVPVGEEETKKAHALARTAIEGILKRKFEPKTGPHCTQCDFRSICKTGSEYHRM